MSTPGGFRPKGLARLVFVATPQTHRVPVAVTPPLNPAQGVPKPSQSYKPPGEGAAIPLMPTNGVNGSAPFLGRISLLVMNWVQEEWAAIEKIKQDASKHGWSNHRKTALAEAKLTIPNLASRLDNISEATLRRELKKLNAPSPGDIIRNARIAYAKHLLTHTRILIREVGIRAGYCDQRHFSAIFCEVTLQSPSDFRKAHVHDHASHPPKP